MSTEIVKRADLMPVQETIKIAELFAQSGYFSDARQMAQAVVKLIAGQELGVPAIMAMTNLYIVQGRVALGAQLIASLIKSSGRYNYRVRELTDQRCVIEFFENGESIGISSFDAEDAKRAGTKNMQQFPRNMLFARAMSNGARWFTPDIFGGSVYTPEELRGAAPPDGDPVIVIENTAQEVPHAQDERRQKLIKGLERLWEQRAQFDDSFASANRRRNSVAGFLKEAGMSSSVREHLDDTADPREWLRIWLEQADPEELRQYGVQLKRKLRELQTVGQAPTTCAGCGKEFADGEWQDWYGDKIYCVECIPDRDDESD